MAKSVQLPAPLQGSGMQLFLSRQVSPLKPSAQAQEKLLMASVQVPPLRQGSEAQSSMLRHVAVLFSEESS